MAMMPMISSPLSGRVTARTGPHLAAWTYLAAWMGIALIGMLFTRTGRAAEA
ncbi:hypothetical protein [Streptosporangium subroseum]|nr:hypothetical protein [Streptosporangium subroseum]